MAAFLEPGFRGFFGLGGNLLILLLASTDLFFWGSQQKFFVELLLCHSLLRYLFMAAFLEPGFRGFFGLGGNLLILLLASADLFFWGSQPKFFVELLLCHSLLRYLFMATFLEPGFRGFFGLGGNLLILLLASADLFFWEISRNSLWNFCCVTHFYGIFSWRLFPLPVSLQTKPLKFVTKNICNYAFHHNQRFGKEVLQRQLRDLAVRTVHFKLSH